MMNLLFHRFPLLVILALITAVPPSLLAQDSPGDDIRQAIAKVNPAVVRIRVLGTAEAGSPGAISSRTTTGVVISKDGEILTSAFALNGNPAAIFVEDSAGQRTSAKIIATDHVRQLVLLKCAEGDFHLPQFADEVPAVGAWAIAVGRLFPGDHPSSSLGIVSATNRIHGLAIQTDAKISPVNYGGPLLDLQGRVTGILVPLSPQDSDTGVEAGVEWYDSGIGFAIPVSAALNAAAELRSGNDRLRGVMGIGLSTRNPLAEEFEVAAVHPGSPADDAGLKKGDHIIAAAGRQMERFGIFESIIKSRYAGEALPLTIERDGQRQDVVVTLTDKLKVVDRGWLGLMFRSTRKLTDGDTSGIVVSIVPESPGASAGLLSDTTVVAIGGEQTPDSATFLQAMRSLTAGTSVIIRFVTAANTAEPQEVAVTPSGRPADIRDFTAGQVRELLLSDPSPDEPATSWSRSVLDLANVGNAWIYAPPAPPLIDDDGKKPDDDKRQSFGLVLLLSASRQAEELVLRRWRNTCELHRLILAVPQNPEQRELSREDMVLLATTLQNLAEMYPLDHDRIVLVTADPQAELTTQAMLNPRLPEFSAAAFLSGWPRISEATTELLQRKDAAVLLFESPPSERETSALRAAAVDAMRESGVRVSTIDAAEENAPDSEARRISNWALMLKAR